MSAISGAVVDVPGAASLGRLRYPWLFSKRVDLAMIAVPALVTLACFATALFRGEGDSGGVRVSAQWIAAFVLGNTSHVILTYVLLGLRRDVLHATERQAATVILGSMAVFAVAVALGRVTANDPMTRPFFEAFVFVFATHHTLSQAKGFWALYGLSGARQGLPPPSAAERSGQSLFVPLALLLIAVRWTLVGKRPFPEAPPLINVNPGDPAILPMWSQWILLAIWLVYAASLFRSLLAYERLSFPKLFYIGTRIVIVTLELVAPGWGATMSAGLHGIEYYLLTHRMLGPTPNEVGDRLRGALAWVVMFVGMAPILAVGLLRNPFGVALGKSMPSSFDAWALAVVNGIVLAHYFADAFIYRFRIPGVRKVALARLGFGSG
ncbi:Hypothetical protein A7982_03807 [Minicystis rosea]|nr:Hypothetical protein A7982_03807 [Minicystis rosea]